MMKKPYAVKWPRRLTALLLALVITLGLTVPVSAAYRGSVIYIGSAEEFLTFAENCRLDTWSQGKTVILEQDISLSDTDFEPISSFGGTFNGKNHTISGLTLEGSIAPAGLFIQVQTCGVIRELHVSGYIAPSGTKEQVGGIAGISSGLIEDCTFSGIVQGDSDVGGIAGIVTETGRVDSCSVDGNISGESRTGGIAGYSTGSIYGCDNHAAVGYQHVGYNVGGIVGRSCGYIYGCDNTGEVCGRKDVGGIVGQAEPISYQQLMKTKDIPEEFSIFELTFSADEELLSSYEFSYGDSFDQTIYPDIPLKDGYYACWDRADLGDLHFDTRVSVEYIPYVRALASQSERDNGRPVFLAEGIFTDTDLLSAEAEPVSTSEITGTSIDFWEAVKEYFRKLGDGHVGYIPKCVDEQWSVRLPEDSLRTHTLRYYPVDGDAAHKDVLVWSNGGWETVASETVGSCLTFEVDGNDARIAVRSTVSTWWMWLIAWVILGLLIVLLIVTIRKVRKKRRMKKAAAQALPNGCTEDASLMARVQAAEEMLARAQQELAVLKSSQAAASPAFTPPETPPKTHRKRWIFIGIAVLLVLAAVLLVFLLRSDAKDSYDVMRLLRDLSQRQELDMDLSVCIETPDNSVETSAKLFRTEVEGQNISCVTRDGISLYYAGDTVYLENGSAYRVGAMAPDYTKLTEHLLDIYQATDVTREDKGSKTCYRVTASELDAELLMKLLAPDEASALAEAERMEISVWTVDGSADTVEFFGTGVLSDEDRTELTVSGKLEIVSEQRKHTVPEAVCEALTSGNTRGKVKLTSDTLELLVACQDLCGEEPFAADVRLNVNCGPLVLEDTLDLYRTVKYGTAISRVQKEDLAMYFADDEVCDEHVKKLTRGNDTVNYAMLLDAAYDLSQGADVKSSKAGDITTYEVSIEGEALEQVAYAIAPAAEDLDVTLEQGTLRLVLDQGKITSLRFDCGGTIRILAVDAAAEIGCKIICKEVTEEKIPEKVIQALGA